MIKLKKRKDYASIVYILSSLEAYVSSGINFMKALELIEEGLTNKNYKKSIARIYKRISEGESISEAFLEEEDLYTSVFSDMLIVAEQSGELEVVLKNMTVHFEKKASLSKEVFAATLYPKLLFGISFIVFMLFIDFVLPEIVSMYEGLEAELNIMTRFVIALNGFFEIYNIYLFFSGVLIVVIGLYFFVRWKFKDIDFIGFLSIRKRYKELSIVSILKLVIESGVPLISALERLSHSIAEKYTRDYIKIILEALRRGEDMSYAIGQIDVMSSVSKSFFLCGEKSGRLDITTSKLVGILEKDFSGRLKSMVSKIEPISICILGLMVLGLVLMVFIPMYDYMSYV